MPRKARAMSSTNFYHVIMRGINQEAIFHKSAYKRKLLHTMLEKQDKHPVEIYGYCIMNNHIHLLVRGEIRVLSSFIACINTAFAMYYNRMNQRIGYVFQDRFKSYPIEDENYFWTCLRYIHNNPVKAKICIKAKDYKWSSFNGYINKADILLDSQSYVFMKKTYVHAEEFLTYHHQKDFNLYPDVEEDYKIMQMEIAEYLVEMIVEKYRLESKWDIPGDKWAKRELKMILREEAKLKQSEIREYILGLEE